MGITNRAKDASERNFEKEVHLGAFPTSTTRQLFVAPYPCKLKQVKVTAVGASGSPQHAMQIHRFVTGAGETTITVVAAAAVTAFGTSGLFGASLPASGSSLVQLQTGDILEVVSSVANTNFTDCTYAVVLEALQDIKTYFGTSYT